MEKIFSKYEKIILSIAKKYHDEEKHQPRKVDYCNDVVQAFNSIEGNDKVTEKRARSQISRVIDRLSEGTNNKLLCIKGKYYVLNTKRYLKEKITEEYFAYLKDKVKVLRRDIHIISYNMCAALMEPMEETEKIVKIVSECLGENCFKVTKSKDMVLMLIKSNPNKNYFSSEDGRDYLVINAIGNAISRIYDEQQKRGLKPLKRKRRIKQKKNDDLENNAVGS